MNPTTRWLLLAAILGGASVGLGAFGAHGLPRYLAPQDLTSELLARRLDNWETAAKYQMYHALALMAIAWLASQTPSMYVNLAGWFFVVGVGIFSGCLYLLVLSGKGILGAIVPIGGLLLILGWVFLAIAAVTSSGGTPVDK